MAKKKSFSIGDAAANVMIDIAERVETTEIKAKNDIREININKIKPSDKNTFGMRDIEKLADSIKEYGQLENAVVRRIDDTEFEFEMISGHRRQEAIKVLGQETILCKVVEADDLLAEAMLIIANLETRELSDLEKSNSAVRLVEIVEKRRKSGENFEGKKTREIVAEMMSTESEKIAPAKVQKLLKVQELIPEFKEQLDKGDLALEKANQLAQMTPEQQKMIYDMFEQQGKELTAKKAKELKDSLQKSDNEKETIEKIKKELEEKQEELQKTNEKLKEVETENDSLNNMVKSFEEKISVIEKEKDKREEDYNKRKKALEKEIEERKKDLEKEQKEEVEKASKKKINDLEEKLKKLQAEEEEKRIKQEEEINQLKKKLEEKENERKDAEIKEKKIVGNMEIKALAEQARKILSSLTSKISEYNQIEGFEITEEVQKVLNEISEYEN